MKIQNGFISSSSSVSVTYFATPSRITTTSLGYVTDHIDQYNVYDTGVGSTYGLMSQFYSDYKGTQSLSWQTQASTTYEKIESFLEVTEKLGEPYQKNNLYFQNMENYSPTVALEDGIYNGFVDIVITLPKKARLAGIELINPWVSNRFGVEYASHWRYLPVKFNIYKVNTEDKNGNKILNNALEEISYENDIANNSTVNKERTLRPIKYNSLNGDDYLTLLGSYFDVDWQNISSYKCFFKYNPNDPKSQNTGYNTGTNGTATWECKQLVLRIFETKERVQHLNVKINSTTSKIEDLIYDYMLSKEIGYGTTYAGKKPTISQIKTLFGKENISANNNPTGNGNWNFGSMYIRSYSRVGDFKFKSGIDYKLGGIQLLLAPDVFSISEMKMYNYDGSALNKVYIGEYDNETNEIYYYGGKTVKQSPYVDINNVNSLITWRHNFNIPSNYLEGKIYIRFNMSFSNFEVGDIIDNIVDVDNNPISIKLTNNTISINLSQGIGFVNPHTGKFMAFNGGTGMQMDEPGDYEALAAAIDLGATVISSGSSKAASITGGYPFQLYFVVKRLF